MTMDWSSLYTLTKLAYKTHSHKETNIYIHIWSIHRIIPRKAKKCKYTITFLIFLSFSCFEDLFNISATLKSFYKYYRDASAPLAAKRRVEKSTYFQIFASINCWDQVTVIDKNLHQHFTHPSTLHCLLFPLLHSRRSFLNYSRSSSLTVPRDVAQYQRSWKTLFASGWTCVSASTKLGG